MQSEKEKGIRDFLNAIDENMKDLDFVNDNVRITFPPHYSIVQYYVRTYYKFLQPLILAQLDSDNVPTQDRLSVVSWIAKFKQRINALDKEMRNKYNDTGVDIEALIDNLSDQENALLQSYIATCRDKLAQWITNIVAQESAKQEHFMVENVPCTHCPAR